MAANNSNSLLYVLDRVGVSLGHCVSLLHSINNLKRSHKPKEEHYNGNEQIIDDGKIARLGTTDLQEAVLLYLQNDA